MVRERVFIAERSVILNGIINGLMVWHFSYLFLFCLLRYKRNNRVWDVVFWENNQLQGNFQTPNVVCFIYWLSLSTQILLFSITYMRKKVLAWEVKQLLAHWPWIDDASMIIDDWTQNQHIFCIVVSVNKDTGMLFFALDTTNKCIFGCV